MKQPEPEQVVLEKRLNGADPMPGRAESFNVAVAHFNYADEAISTGL